MMGRSLSPQTSHLTSHIQRPTNLRVVIPGPQSGLTLSAHDRGEFPRMQLTRRPVDGARVVAPSSPARLSRHPWPISRNLKFELC